MRALIEVVGALGVGLALYVGFIWIARHFVRVTDEKGNEITDPDDDDPRHRQPQPEDEANDPNWL